MITGVLTTLACGCLLAIPALGELYKWTDAEGKVHYSDQPPPPNIKEPVTVKPRVPSAPTAAPAAEGTPAAAPKTYVEQDAEFNRRRVEAAEREATEKKAAKEAAEKKKNCEQAKAQLAGVQSGARIARYNDKGERVYLGDAEIAQEAARAKQVADSWCK
jgi:type IV secretory pathway VirB10-like protein